MAREYLYDVRPDPAPLIRPPEPVRRWSLSIPDMPQTGAEVDRLISEQEKDKVRTVTRRARRPGHGVFRLGKENDPRRGGRSGLRVARAPVGVRSNHGHLAAVMTADDWVNDMFGLIRLKVTPESVYLHRLESGLLSMPQDHDTSKPIGRWTEAKVEGGRLLGVAEIGNYKRAVEVEQEIVEGSRFGFSIGFIILESRLLERDDPDYAAAQIRIEISRFFPYECSTVAAPMIPGATLQTIKTKRRRS